MLLSGLHAGNIGYGGASPPGKRESSTLKKNRRRPPRINASSGSSAGRQIISPHVCGMNDRRRLSAGLPAITAAGVVPAATPIARYFILGGWYPADDPHKHERYEVVMLDRITWLVRGVALALTLSSIACGSSMSEHDVAATPLSPISPSSQIIQAPAAATQNANLTGTVSLRSAGGVRAFAGVPVWGWVETSNYGHRIGPVMTDADGRYAFHVAPGSFVRVQVAANYQPCVAGVAITGETTRDVEIINDPEQLGNNLPAQLLADTPTLSGTVFETTAQGPRPVPQARVELDMIFGMGDVSATTLTDADGRYVLCGLRGYETTYMYISKSGYRLGEVGTVSLNGNTVRDIELRR